MFSKTWPDGTDVQSYILVGTSTLTNKMLVQNSEIAVIDFWTGPQKTDNYVRVCVYPYYFTNEDNNNEKSYDIFNCKYAGEFNMSKETIKKYNSFDNKLSIKMEVTLKAGAGKDYVGMGQDATLNANILSINVK